MRRVLLASGIAAPLLYAVADVVAGMRWEGYSFRDQTISELGAVGAPSRLVFSVLLVVVYGLMVAFGMGVWKVAGENRRLRLAGGLLVGEGVMALTVGQLAAMSVRGTDQGLAGTIVQGLATPWVGVKERIFWYGYQSWYIVLAVTLLGRRNWSER